MKRGFFVLMWTVLLVGCGSDSTPTTPSSPAQTPTAPAVVQILPANLVVPSNATFDTPNCQAKANLAALLNMTTVTCPTFTGTMQNTGSGCAANISGTTTTSTTSGQSLGVATWIAAGTVRPGATVVYTGGQLTVSVATTYNYRTVATWTNVACS